MEEVGWILVIIAIMIFLVGIRQELHIREQRNFLRWFYSNINFLDEKGNDKNEHI